MHQMDCYINIITSKFKVFNSFKTNINENKNFYSMIYINKRHLMKNILVVYLDS